MFGSHKELVKNGRVKVKLADGTWFGEAGEIELLNNEVNSRTDAIQIYASFPNKERKLIQGSTLSVTLSRKNGKLLPAISPSALMHDEKGSYVYILDSENKVEKRYVTPGNATSKLQMIKAGLKKGEIVVAKGTHKAMPGMKVEPDTTVCIIEAMKVMNEIKAEKSGVIKEVLVENGQPVEFGQPLFTLE